MRQALHVLVLALAIFVCGVRGEAGNVLAQSPDEFRAQLVAVRKPVMAAEIAGKVDKVAFRPGEAFKAGDVLLSFDCSLNKVRADRARALRNRSDSQLKSLLMLEKRGATSKLEVALARSDVAGAVAELNAANLLVERCDLKAPFSGRVVEQRIQAGEYATEGQPLVEILDDSEFELETIVPSSLLPSIAIGAAVDVNFDEIGGSVQFVWARISPQIDPVSRTIKLYAKLAAPQGKLVSGMSGRLRLSTPPGP